MKKLLLFASILIGLNCYGQSKMNIVLYPCSDYEVERANQIISDDQFSEFNISIVKKCPDASYQNKLQVVKVEFFIDGVTKPMSAIYGGHLPSNNTLKQFTYQANLICSDPVIVNHMRKSLVLLE